MKNKILFQLVEENSLTVKETADYFGGSNHVVNYWIYNSIIKATKKGTVHLGILLSIKQVKKDSKNGFNIQVALIQNLIEESAL